MGTDGRAVLDRLCAKASRLLAPGDTPHATCPPNSDPTTASLTVPGLASVQALHAECTLESSTGHTDASARTDSWRSTRYEW